jgi:acetoacetate decarboxylase
MPALGGRRPSTWQFTTFPSKTVITETQVGKGSIDWEHLTWEQDPTQFHIVNALADLPNLGVVYTAVTKGLLTLSQKENPYGR